MRVWDLATRRPIVKLHTRGGEPVHFADFGETRRAILTLEGTEDVVLATCSSHGVIVRTWSLDAGPVITLRAADFQGECGFAPDGTLFSASGAGEVLAWDVAARKVVRSFQGPGPLVLGLDATLGRVVFEVQGAVKILDLDGRERHELPVPPEHACLFSESRDGTRCAVGDLASGDVRVLDVASGRCLLQRDLEYVAAAALSPDGTTLASNAHERVRTMSAEGDPHGGVSLLDVASGEKKLLPYPDYSQVNRLLFAPDGTRLAANHSHAIDIWDVASRKVATSLPEEPGLGTAALCWSPDGRFLAVSSAASVDGSPRRAIVRIWDAATGRSLLGLRGHEHRVSGLAWSADGKRLATASQDRTVRVWDVPALREVFTRSPRELEAEVEARTGLVVRDLEVATLEGD